MKAAVASALDAAVAAASVRQPLVNQWYECPELLIIMLLFFLLLMLHLPLLLFLG